MALQTNPRSWNRVDGIDLLRGLSILFVLMNHVNMRLLGAKLAYTRGLPPQLVYALVWNGGFAVQMFFAISGYLITSTSIRRWGTPAALSPRGFYLLRIARIAPLLLLLIALLSTLHLAGVPGYIVSQKTGGLPRALLAALTFHINLLEATRDYLPANWDILWSLSVEEMFYLFFPLAARIFRRTRYLIPLLILFILAGPFARTATFDHNAVWREYSYLGGMDAIALGCLAAILLAHAKLTRAHQIACGLAGSTLLIFCFCFSLTAYRWGLGRTGLAATLVGLGVCLVIARRLAVTVEGAPHPRPIAHPRPAQLRDLPHPHVRRHGALRNLRPCRQAHASHPPALSRVHRTGRSSRLGRRCRLRRTHEPPHPQQNRRGRPKHRRRSPASRLKLNS